MRAPRYRSVVFAALGLSAFSARATSLSDLYSRVPAPPGDVATALSWAQNGQIVAPEYTAFKQALEAERAAVATLNGGSLPVMDPAPALDAGEPAEVQGTFKAYNDYLATHSGDQDPAAVLGKRTRWLQRAMGGRLGALLEKMRPCPAPCNDAAVIAQNQPLQADKDRLAQQDIAQWNTLFADWKRSRSAILDNAQMQIAATGEGAKARSAAGRTAVARYRAAMLREVDVALSVTELAVKRAWAIESGQPDAVSSATRSAKK